MNARPFDSRARFIQSMPYFYNLRPTVREWFFHTALLLVTFATATFSGMLLMATDDVPEPILASPVTVVDYILYPFAYYFQSVALFAVHGLRDAALMTDSLLFSTTLLAILAAHEAGHYIACRLYGVRATLPYFLPAPPPLLAGTFGAFIKIRSPIPSRRALFDIAVAGPLAGFAVAILAACATLLTAQPAAPFAPLDATSIGSVAVFNDPWLLRLLAGVFAVDVAHIAPNPFFFATWIGCLVTALNLMPVGQLDGGHISFAVFGHTIYKWLARATFAAMLVIAPLGWFWHHVPSGFLYVVLLGVMLRFGHPQPLVEGDRLGWVRGLLAFLALIVFALAFLPFPLTLT